MGLLDDIQQYGLLGGGAGLLGINPAYGAVAGNAARGALAGTMAPPGVKGFWNRLSYGAGAGQAAAQQNDQFRLRQKLGYQQLQTGSLEQKAAERQNRLGTITENYYRRQNGLPELPVDWNGPASSSSAGNTPEGTPQQIAQMRGAMNSPFGQAATQATRVASGNLSDSPAGAAPGVPAAAAPLSQGGMNQGSDEWWQALYQQGQSMLGVPGMANDAVTLMEKAKAHDPSVLQSEAYAKAVGTAAGTPNRVYAGGSLVDGNGRVIYQAPVLTDAVDNNPASPNYGQKIKIAIDPRTGGAYNGGSQPQQQGAAPPVTTDNIYDAADADYGLPPGSMRAISGLENGKKDPNAVSPNGKGIGLVQINPDTVPPGTDLRKRLKNVDIGAARLAEYQKQFSRYANVDPQLPQWLGAAAYVWGNGNVEGWIKNDHGDINKMPQNVAKYANDYMTGINSHAPSAQPSPQAAPAPTAGPQGTTTELSPAQTKELVGQAEIHNMQREDTNRQAQAASAQQALLEEMRVAAQGFKMGAGADVVGNVQNWANYFGVGSDEMIKKLADWQQFRKDAIQIAQPAITAVSSREAYQGQRMIMESLPGTKMSPQGFAQIVDQLSSVNDYSLAKQQWATKQPIGTDIDATWNAHMKLAGPSVFWLQRLKASGEAPIVIGKLATTAQGQALLARVSEANKWLVSQGLATDE